MSWDTVAVVALLLAVVGGLAYCAGLGRGSAATYEHLRPERMAQELQREAVQTLDQIQRTHARSMEALAEIEPLQPGSRYDNQAVTDLDYRRWQARQPLPLPPVRPPRLADQPRALPPVQRQGWQ